MKLLKLPIAFICVLSIIVSSCNDSTGEKKISQRFHMDKKYWDEQDYSDALAELYTYVEGTKYPNLSDINTAPIFNKLVDINNVSVVVEDTTLGINHRSKFATSMFENYRKLEEYYGKTDREDKFIYPLEIAQIQVFGVYTQINYFKLGNESMIKEAVDPNSDRVKNAVRSNAQTIVHNMKLSLDFCKKENAFTPAALHTLNIGYEKYFSLLVNTFPNSDYSELKSQIDLLGSSVKSSETKEMLGKVMEAILRVEKKDK